MRQTVTALGALLLVALIATAVAPAAGQPTTETLQNETTTYAQEVDPNLRVVSYDFDGNGVTVVFEADRSTIVTVSEINDVDGAGQFFIRRTRLPEGRTEQRFPAPEGITIVTNACIRAESCTKIENDEGLNLLPSPYRSSDVQNAGLGGLLAGLGTTAMIAWRRVKGVSDTPRRIL